MDPLDHLEAPPDGMPCSVCGAAVPTAAIRLLAWRDDLAFLQLSCGTCLSTTLGFAFGGRGETDEADRPGDHAAISSDDVLDMHQFLAGWRGDLASLLRTRSR